MRLKCDLQTFSIGISGAAGTLHIMEAMLTGTCGSDAGKAHVPTFPGGELVPPASAATSIPSSPSHPPNILAHVGAGKLNLLDGATPRRLIGALAACGAR